MSIINETKENELTLISSTTPTKEWQLIWEEHFDQGALNDKYWTAIEGGPTYNNELQYYASRNVTSMSDSLFLTAENEQHDDEHPYTSGKITTQKKVSFHYGKIEIRARHPNEMGMFPAIWMQPIKNVSPEGMAPLPEVDIFESVGNAPETVYSVLHYLATDETVKVDAGTHTLSNSTDFHTYAIEWTHESLKWYIDDVLVHTTYKGIPDKPMYLNINLAVGGSWFPPPNETTRFPAQFEIDYVRYYSNGGI